MKTDENTPTFIIPLEKIDPYLNDPEEIFIGRSRVGNKIFSALKHSCGSSGGGGCFLVGGYRGAGKTVLVKRQIAKLQESKDRKSYQIEEINIDLGVDNEINTREILCDIAESLLLKVRAQVAYQRIFLTLSFLLLAPILLFSIYLIENQTSLVKNLLPETDRTGITANLNLFLACITSVLFLLAALMTQFYQSSIKRIENIINELVISIRYARAFQKNSVVSAKVTSFSVREIRKQEPISTRRIQQRLKFIFSELHSNKIWILAFKHRGKLFDIGKRYIQPIIVFDEIDKINTKNTSDHIKAIKSRKENVDMLLGGLKSLLNRSKAIFIFIAGREMVDAFHSESGYTSVLYEGVFQDIFYIPTLLSDHSDGKTHKLQSMISTYVNEVLTLNGCYNEEHNNLFKKGRQYSAENISEYIEIRYKQQLDKVKRHGYHKEDKNFIYCQSLEKLHLSDELPTEKYLSLHKTDFNFIRRIFVRYLALHTRGNCKRLSLMIHEFIENCNEDTWKIATRANYRIIGGKIRKNSAYLLFRPEDIKRFFLSAKLYSLFDVNTARQLSRTDDKLVVSSLIAMLDITKMHSRGFAREMLDRTVAGIDIHAESNLHNITDELINSTFFSLIRRTSDNIYQYRFYQSSEIEFFFLCKSMGARASSFEYSLDAADPVKNYYLDEVKQQTSENADNSSVSSAKLKVILGDIYFAERVYDKAFSSYCDAVYLLKRILSNSDSLGELNKEGVLVYSHFLLIEVLLKKGLMEEVRENNSASLRTFKEAQAVIQFAPKEAEKRRGFSWKTYTVETTKANGQNILELDSYEKWLTRSIYEANDSTNLNMLVHSMLASDFLSLKSGKSPSSPLSKTIPKFSRQDSAPTLYTKIMIFHFFSMNLNTVLEAAQDLYKDMEDIFRKQNQPRIEHENSENHKEAYPYMASFVYGQVAFSCLANNIKKQGIGVDQASFLEHVVKPWLDLIVELHKYEFQSVPCYTNNDGEINFNIEEMKLGIPSPSHVIKAFEITYFSARGMETRGNYTLAGEMYCAILLNWIALIEFIPWRTILQIPTEDPCLKEAMHLLETRPTWLQTVINHAGNSIRKSEQGTFNGERSQLYPEHSRYQFSHEVGNILAYLNEDGENQKYELASMVTWFRSNTSNYLLMFSLWEAYCRHEIHFWVCRNQKQTSTRDFPIHQLAPPIGSLPRVSAIYLWLRGRREVLNIVQSYCETDINAQIMYKDSVGIKQSSLTEEIQKLCKKLIDIVDIFSQAVDEARLSAKSDDPDTFPPKSIIYDNIIEVLHFLYEPLNTEFKQYIQNHIDKNDKYTGLLKQLFDIAHVTSLQDRSHRDMKELTNIFSNSYRRKMRHKFYLYDDFEDPLFIAEWAFLVMISVGSVQLTTE